MSSSLVLSKKIDLLLGAHALTRRGLSEKLGIHLDILNDIVDGRELPNPDFLKRTCKLFGISEAYFRDELIALAVPDPKAECAQPPDAADTGSKRFKVGDSGILTTRYRAFSSEIVAKRTRKV
jgi:hypothetical protein